MNRLIIIGNGFDLAHGLPTSYRDFIDDFWKNFKDKCKSEDYKDIIYFDDNYNGWYTESDEIKNFKDLKDNLSKYAKIYNLNFNEASCTLFNKFDSIFKFKNDFFKEINIKNSENWVDIENEYYKQLNKIIYSKNTDVSKTEDYWLKHVEKLNNEFDQVKNLLKKYLIDSIEEEYFFCNNNNDWTKFYDVLKPISIVSNESKILEEFKNKNDKGEIKNLFLKEKRETIKKNVMCLNFNYTKTILKYFNSFKEEDCNYENIHIHGELLNDENQINFGFGDEMDQSYRVIENINNNEYLKNFKSFQYLQNNNYDNLLSFIDSEKYQVIILGHSCGLSDRTLLNTIFEHENCRSIKVFYHLKKDGTDNYTDIIQNISRHFNKKKLMREKIVNKTLCKPLPQIQLLKKEIKN